MAQIEYLIVDHLSTKDLTRIFSKICIHPDLWHDGTQCWIWTAARGTKDGYGFTALKREGHRLIKAYRLTYAWLIGPIPKNHPGFGVDHLCRRTSCINPVHLEHVTTRVNILRGNSAQAKNARKTYCLRNHPLSGENLIIEKTGKRQCRKCFAIRWQKYYAKDKQAINRRTTLKRQRGRLNAARLEPPSPDL